MKSILIVEDNAKIAKAVGARLKHSGFAVRIATDAPSALMQARKQAPDVAILDISIPGGNGMSVAENMNLNICDTEIPVIFITASKDPELKKRAKKMHAVAFLEKPFSAQMLLSAIDTALLQPNAEMEVAAAQYC